ncbi:MAG: hypothetical protein AABX03_01360, partial [Nanoarchaeota archaeon]
SIFLILNLVFFLILMLFVVRASSGAFVTEQFYAKQVGLMIDASNPGTKISIDITDATEIAKKNQKPFQNIFAFKDNGVYVSLSNSRIYSFRYFSDVSVETSYRTELDGKNKEKIFLDIYLRDRNE